MEDLLGFFRVSSKYTPGQKDRTSVSRMTHGVKNEISKRSTSHNAVAVLVAVACSPPLALTVSSSRQRTVCCLSPQRSVSRLSRQGTVCRLSQQGTVCRLNQ